MKITVVGRWGAFPEQGEATACYIVEHDGYCFLLDCGSGALSSLQTYIDRRQIAAVISTHHHFDHVADLGALVYSRVVDQALNDTDKTLAIHCPHESRLHYEQYEKTPAAEVISYQETGVIKLGGVTVTFQRTGHPVPCFAVRLEAEGKTIVFTADAVYDEKLGVFAYGADLLIAESSFYAGQDAKGFGHMTSEECGKLARNAKAGELWLTHLPHFGEVAELKKQAEKEFSGAVKLAEAGLTMQAE
ncbi:MBL fold metallo-hydrolase [Alkalicoccus luteus]|uniref:MBL fold metallo-hydrolase n=1 Tax=Alkalicoccus luteus TaxID=1237094 RepID=A0A969TSN9_9BACI|nr:MBL fold metallo-hydrolase [Alkalicoccus luteus]NJP36773.1 MBL fold metallo-hydrolase [Alkalicoccus luteus]